MSSESDEENSSYSDEKETNKKEPFSQIKPEQNIKNKENSELLAPPPNFDSSTIETLKFNVPPNVSINASNWRDFKLAQVPLPNDNEIEEELAKKFDLTALYQQIRTV